MYSIFSSCRRLVYPRWHTKPLSEEVEIPPTTNSLSVCEPIGLLPSLRLPSLRLSSGPQLWGRRVSPKFLYVHHMLVDWVTDSILQWLHSTINDWDIAAVTEGPNGVCSPWHDVPLHADKQNNILNMVVEIPRWSNAKMEVGSRAHRDGFGSTLHYRGSNN